MTRAPLITFLSDFGRDDWFVGVVHGVIHDVCPAARVVDITHAVPPGKLWHAAFVLEVAAPDFSAGAVHLAVVDPGVGTERRALAVRAHGQLFVGPDNGILEWALTDPAAEVHEITEPRYGRVPMSRTFHARDVFAPAAAHLAAGEPLDQFGPRISDPVRGCRPQPQLKEGELIGQVMLIDRFGNAITNLTETARQSAGFLDGSRASFEVEAADRVLHGLTRAYGDAPVGTLVALIGSSGRLEIAQVGGDAAERLGLGVGDEVRLRLP
jgi:S-adenosyl-L-methionine hydrolase (adenosine-forming)